MKTFWLGNKCSTSCSHVWKKMIKIFRLWAYNHIFLLHCSVSIVVHFAGKSPALILVHFSAQSLFCMRQYVHSVATCSSKVQSRLCLGGNDGKGKKWNGENWNFHLQDYDRRSRSGGKRHALIECEIKRRRKK